MTKRPTPSCRFWSLLLFGLLFVAGCGGAQNAAHPPNVILIVVDTLRADHLRSYGYSRSTSPNLDRLAADGARFERAYSQAPWTTPSIGSLLSSRYPSTLGITELVSPLPEEPVVLSEFLRSQGWTTGAFISHSFCSAKWGFAQGFDHFDGSNIRGHVEITSPRISDMAIDWIGANRNRPFFLFLHYFDPHFAYVDNPDFDFGGRPDGYAGMVESPAVPQLYVGAIDDLTPADVAELERLYDGEVALTDREIGRVLDALRELGLYDDSIIVFTADHGEEFMDHGALDHTKTLYDELVNVPLIIKAPGVAPSVVGEPVGLVDVYPTIAGLIGRPAPDGLVGRNLFADAADTDGPEPVFSETMRVRQLQSVVEGRYKLILDRETGADELYDLSEDPGETRNLSAVRPDVAKRLRTHLERWAFEHPEPGHKPAPLELSDEESERLKALGYH